MANMIKQYEKVMAFKCSSKDFPELGSIAVFAYNYSEARNLAKGVFKEVNPAVRYLGIRASIVLKDVPKELNNKVCFNENHEGYELVSEFL